MSQLRFTYLGVRAQKALRAATSQAVAEGEKLLNHIISPESSSRWIAWSGLKR